MFPFANLHPNAGAQLRSEILLLHLTLLPNGGRNLALDHVPNAPNPSGENESVQVSTGSLANPGESNEVASAGHTVFVPGAEDPGASHDGDHPRTGRAGPDAASGSAPHHLVVPDGATLTAPISSGPQRSAMHPSKPASGGVENQSAHLLA
jgi:hypothetical protein